MKRYGGSTIMDELFEGGDINIPRNTFEECVEYIVRLCDEAAIGLPLRYPDNDYGRLTKGAALGLKARVLLYAASPLFNPTNDKTLWKRAVEANKELIDDYDPSAVNLVDNYSSLWGVDNYKDTREIIFSRRANKETSTMESYNFPAGLSGSKGGNCPTQTLVDAYEMKETGLAWNEQGSGYLESDPYEGRDPRFAMTIARNGETGWPIWNTEALETYQNGANGEPNTGGTPTGYYLKKYCQGDIDLRDNSTKKVAYHTWVTFRLGEFYLNYAEALFRYLDNDPYKIDPEFGTSANDMVYKTRKRAGMPAFPAEMSADAWWKKYKNERMVELAFEGHRFWDVRRWKEADKHFTSIDEMKITKNGSGFVYTRNTVNRQWDDKMYLFPIPRTEIMKNPNLEQNPGW